MRYRVIDDKRLNIYLTKQDLQKENVSIEDVVEGRPETVSRIKKIFQAVSKLTEFDIKDAGLNIVLMPIVDGDLLISACVAEEKELFGMKNVFLYQDFEDVLSAASHLMRNYDGTSSLYKLEDKYCLLLKIKSCFKKKYDYLISVLSEFGQKSELGELYIKEHGKNLIKNNAVETLCCCFYEK